MGEKPVVAFLGPKASYTHQATLSRFPDSKYTITPQTSIADVFASVQNNSSTYGVVPFENSSNGPVIFTLDLFADLNGKYPDILVTGEIYLAVRHCLLGHKHSSTNEGGQKRFDLPWRSPQKSPSTTSKDFSHIRTLYSHPQAWTQCTKFLSSHFPTASRLDTPSTSKAAEIVSADPSGTSAAISSKIAAGLNNLDILEEGIEDNEGNSTRFFILQKSSSSSSQQQESAADYKSLITFTVSHSAPGALANSLAVFTKHALNLTSINTRPSGQAPWHYIFFIETRGKRVEAEDGVLADLREVAERVKWLGSWENQLGR